MGLGQRDVGMPADRLGEDEDGRRKYPEQSFIEAIGESDTPTTTDVSEYVGCTPQAALYRLNQMEDEDTVTSKMVGNTKVWRISGH